MFSAMAWKLLFLLFSLPLVEVYCIRLSLFPCLVAVIAGFYYFFSSFLLVWGERKICEVVLVFCLNAEAPYEGVSVCFCIGTFKHVALVRIFLSGCVRDLEDRV